MEEYQRIHLGIITSKVDFVGISEAHTNGDPAKQLIPQGYIVVARMDRTVNGGGLWICAKKHLLVDSLDKQLKPYQIKCVAEMIGVEYQAVQYILCYTPDSSLAPQLFDKMAQHEAEHPHKRRVYI